jgi:alpha,alpha-trehalase
LKEKMNSLMWDDKEGMFFDFNFKTQTRRADYPYITTFLPLWAGSASRAQARRLVKNLHRFEREGGLATSLNQHSSGQWDGDLVWAPLVVMAVKGLRKYGYQEEANRISMNWLGMVVKDFQRTHKLFEKYDGKSLSSDVSALIKHGYKSKVEGFGWTNAALLELWAGLPAEAQAEFRANGPPGLPKSIQAL